MAARASAQVPARPRKRDADWFKEYEEAFFRAGEATADRPDPSAVTPSKWRRILARTVALTIFSAALVMAWKAFGNTLRHEAAIRTQLQSAALCAHVVGDRGAWAAPETTVRPSTPRQHPHSTTAARNRRR